MSENSTFEKDLEELEFVVNNLEKGNLSLEEAISTFEKGIKLSKECSEKLDKAEKKISILVQNGENLEENFIQDKE